MTTIADDPRTKGLLAIVGFLVCVELASGILQGYYTPIFSDIADHLGIADADVNWFEAAQLIVSALVVPPLARMGDLVGHKKVLLLSTAVTALGSWVMAFAPSFTTFLIGSALQGAYVVWLPLEVAIIYRRTAGTGRQNQLTRRSAAILVGALELAVIVGALTSGALVDATSMTVLLALPAIAVTVCLIVIWFGIEDMEGTATGGIDLGGLVLITSSIGLVMGGLIAIRLDGPASPLPWTLIALGLVVLYVFGRYELGQTEPLVDVRLLGTPGQWPVQLTAFLFGMSVLGAQIPLSTFARTDPDVYGYGLGTTGFATSLIIGIYLIGMIAGALLFPVIARVTTPRLTLLGASVLVGVGFLLFLPFHDAYLQVVTNMVIVGLGSGALVAALPAAAASAAPDTQTGVATGLTNSVKTIGGAIASCVFGIALLHGAASTASGVEGTAGSLEGYFIVWIVCGVTALAAAVLLLFVPKRAFTDRVTEVETAPMV